MPQNNKYGMLITPDIKLHRQWFEEMLMLRGINVKVKTPSSNKQYTDNGELVSNYNEWYDTGCIFEDYPSQKTMRKLGWYVEGDTDSSLIHLPYDTPNIQQGTLVAIPSSIAGSQDRIFRIVEMSLGMVYPASITCRVVPEWQNTTTLAETHDYTKSSYNFVREVAEWEN